MGAGGGDGRLPAERDRHGLPAGSAPDEGERLPFGQAVGPAGLRRAPSRLEAERRQLGAAGPARAGERDRPVGREQRQHLRGGPGDRRGESDRRGDEDGRKYPA